MAIPSGQFEMDMGAFDEGEDELLGPGFTPNMDMDLMQSMNNNDQKSLNLPPSMMAAQQQQQQQQQGNFNQVDWHPVSQKKKSSLKDWCLVASWVLFAVLIAIIAGATIGILIATGVQIGNLEYKLGHLYVKIPYAPMVA